MAGIKALATNGTTYFDDHESEYHFDQCNGRDWTDDGSRRQRRRLHEDRSRRRSGVSRSSHNRRARRHLKSSSSTSSGSSTSNAAAEGGDGGDDGLEQMGAVNFLGPLLLLVLCLVLAFLRSQCARRRPTRTPRTWPPLRRDYARHLQRNVLDQHWARGARAWLCAHPQTPQAPCSCLAATTCGARRSTSCSISRTASP